ncbi:MAG: hypothetical protein PF484_11820 [Bacteroidales bacterium]|jgi:tetratricopeptide (TPR) repeat protein|nr:hypothetical protein [Bacteroidales bacterium]
MSKFTLLAIILVSLFITGCSGTSKISKQNTIASDAAAAGDFETAFNYYNNFIKEQQSKNKEIDGEIYGAAANTALKINKYIVAEKYFKQASYKGYADPDLYANMQSVYKSIDNLSKEIEVLEYFVEHFVTDVRFSVQSKRLFETYIESENWNKAIAMWPSFDARTQTSVQMMDLYLIAQKKLNNDDVVNLIATAILKKDVTNRSALEWMAEKYFWKAEKRYQNELDAYEKNKTNKQYNIMVKALDIVTADFKKSLGYYKKLYKLYPSKEYAKYMGNIYTRFLDKKKSEYYLNLSK